MTWPGNSARYSRASANAASDKSTPSYIVGGQPLQAGRKVARIAAAQIQQSIIFVIIALPADPRYRYRFPVEHIVVLRDQVIERPGACEDGGGFGRSHELAVSSLDRTLQYTEAQRYPYCHTDQR